MSALNLIALDYASEDEKPQKSKKKKKVKNLNENNRKSSTEIQKQKHPRIEKSCLGSCNRDCIKLTTEIQERIYNTFWTNDYTTRRNWLWKNIDFLEVKSHMKTAVSRKGESRAFYVPDPDSHLHRFRVCKKTFLEVLGYTNDKVITKLSAVVRKDPAGSKVKENRGGNHSVVDEGIILEHILSYNPKESHYHRENAPEMKYLPRELTLDIMFSNFQMNYPGVAGGTKYHEVNIIFFVVLPKF